MSSLPPSRPMTPLGGRYALREPLGEGSFAITYLAEDLTLGRLVAVKVLHARYGNDPAAAARFGREARAAAAVSSPYLVDVFDFGTDQGSSYIVLQYVAGPTLRDLIDRAGRLAPREAVRIAIDILRGLAVLHLAGIIHRDIKPQNVLIDRNGTARVTDFGVALWSGMEHLTSHGLAVGTAVYMAPEQASGAEVAPAADLYAVGVLLFEMLAGRPPFRAEHPAALMLAHVQQSPPLPSDVAPSLTLPVPLEREVMRALAKEPGDRPASAMVMAAALEAAGLGETLATGSPAQNETTATVPALGGHQAALHATETSVAPAVRRTAGRRGQLWLAPLALLVLALVIVWGLALSGELSGLAGLLAPAQNQENTGPPVTTPTPDNTTTQGVAATFTPAPPATEVPAPTVAALVESGQPLFPIGQAREPGETQPESAAASTAPPATSTPALAPPTAPVGSIAVAPPTEAVANADDPTVTADPGSGSGAQDGSTLSFGPGDWLGVPPADPEFGRSAVALYGAEGDAARATLQFELPNGPPGPMRLSLTGLGDETGMPFPFGIEVNGMYVGQSPATFANWHPAQDGLNGEQAPWDQVHISLPAEIFYPGLNEISIVSLSPGAYDDRPPYLLLSDATLTPQ